MKADIVPSRKRRFFRWMRYLLTVLVGLLMALVCAGVIYEGIESRRDRRQYHPPGRLAEIDGYRLHLYCMGEGSPTAILEAGGGNPWLSWYKVQPRVAAFTRVVPMTEEDLPSESPQEA